MKHNMNRVLSIVALLMLTIGAWAEAERVNITKNPEDCGTVTYNISENVCTLTVTPADGYYLTVANLTAVKVISGSVVQAPARRSIDIDENVTITATNASADPSSVTTYTFPMPSDANISVNVTAEFQARTSIAKASITLAATEFTYDGTAKEPAVSSVVLGQTTLNAADYEVSYSNNTDAGTATVTVTGKRTYTGTATTTFTIKQATFTPMVTLESWTYGSAPNSPSVQNNVSNGDVAYSYAVRGTTKFSETVPTAAGEYTVKATIAATANYEAAEATADFAIIGKTITDGMVTIEGTSFVFNNDVQVPNVTVTDGTNTLGVNDYAVSYELVGDEVTTPLESANSVVNAGDYNVVITGKGNYTGTVKKSFKITKATLKNLAVTLTGWTYGATANTPAVTGKPDDAEVTYTYSVDTTDPKDQVFTATVPSDAGDYIVKATVAASANYQGGEATKTFTIAKADIAESQFTKPQGVEKLTYTGAAQQLVTAGSVPTGATIKFYSEYVPNYYDGFNLNCLANTYTYTADIPTGTNAGYYAVLYKVDGGTNYKDVEPGQTVIVFVDSVDVKDATIEAIADTAFTGEAIEPELTVTFGQIPMVLGTDYTVAYTDNVSAGKATATITGKGNYKGTKSVNFNIVRKAITDEMVTLSPETFTYNGSAQTPTVTVAYKIDEQTTKTLTENTDYTISYQKVVGGTPETVTSPTDAGEYNVVVTGKGNYSGTASATFTINAASIAGATIAAIAEQTFTGSAITPALTVTLMFGETQTELEQDEDYTVSYSNNVNVGQATATVTGTGNYTGSKTANFNITGKAITDAMVTLSPETFTYNGSAQTPTVTVAYKIDEQTTKTLTENTDYTISYKKVDGETTTTVESPTDAGEYNVVVTGKGNYSGTVTKSFTIIAADIAKATIAAIENKTFTGDFIKPNLSVTLGNYTLIANKDYTVVYTDNVSAGTATATITGQGNFTGTNSAKFTIVNQTLDVTENDFHNHWMTYYSANGDIDIPESSNIGAYVATSVTGNTVTVTQISYIPEGVAVLLNNETTTTTDKEFNNDQDHNLLVHATTAKQVKSGEGDFYGLYEGEFRRVTGTIPAGKNYLRVWEAQAPKLTIVFDDDVNTTGISGATLVNSEEVKGDLYDLQGRKVIYPKKGLYIKNGRKVVVNNK